MTTNLKCVDCVLFRLERKNINTADMVQEAVDSSNLAVTVMDGIAVCASHLHSRLISRLGKQISETLSKTQP
jgi:hypothetical protein